MELSHRVDDHYIYIRSSFQFKDEIKASLQSARWEGETKEWRGIKGARNFYLVNHVWKGSPEFKRYYTDPPQSLIDEVKSRFKGRWSHQSLAAAYMIHRKRFIYAAEMALGKTLTVFDAVDYVAGGTRGQVWWVSDKNSLKAFSREYDLWKPSWSPGVVVNYESLKTACRQAKKPPRVIVFDECSALKNPTSGRTQAALALVDFMQAEYGDDCYVFMLSGTPAPKDICDWWAICEVCRPGFLRESRIEKFRERYMVCDRAERGYLTPLKDENNQFIYTDEYPKLGKRLAPLVLVHRRGVDNPDMRQLTKQYQEVRCEVNAEAIAAARLVVKTAPNAGAALQATRQLSDGISVANGTFWDCPKDEALVSHLSKHSNRCIIYAAFRLSIDKIVKHCLAAGWSVIRVDGRGWQGYDRLDGQSSDWMLGLFQDVRRAPFPIAFVAHPRAAGKGLTLTASPSIAFYSRTYMYEDSAQAEDRIMRESSTGQLIVDFMHMPIDYKVMENVRAKRKGSNVTFNDIRQAYGLPPTEDGNEIAEAEDEGSEVLV